VKVFFRNDIGFQKTCPKRKKGGSLDRHEKEGKILEHQERRAW
jgi:hypothetical protein